MTDIEKLESKFYGQSPLPPLRILSASGQLGYSISQAAADTRQDCSSYN